MAPSAKSKIDEVAQLLAGARGGRRPLGCQVAWDAPEIVEVIGNLGFEWTLINNEHTLLSGARTIANAVRATELFGRATLVKLAKCDPLLARDSLDAGAHGVHVPFVSSAQQLRDILDECKFAPEGKRGFCPVTRSFGFYGSRDDGDTARAFLEFANQHALIVPIIETPDAINDLDAMLEIPGIPVYSIGPADLGFSLREVTPQPTVGYVIATCMAIAKKIHAAGRLVSMPYMTGLGLPAEYRLLNTVNDLPYIGEMWCMYAGMKSVLEEHQKFVDGGAKMTLPEPDAEPAQAAARKG